MSSIVQTLPNFDVGAAPDVNFHIVLVEPEIPQNTGSVARLAAATHAWLHIVQPIGFALEDRYLKRAGLDYWPSVTLSVHESLATLEPMLPQGRTYLFTKQASRSYWDAGMERGAVLVFGRESKGLPAEFIARWTGQGVSIPTTGGVRSLNLATAVGVGGYEVVRRIASDQKFLHEAAGYRGQKWHLG
jgi:tRNA (cytidine/uridine-2'-O-)-methyltransferase